MSYFDRFNTQESKLESTLAEQYLLHKFDATSYPMTLTITQNQTPDAQMALFDQDTDGVSSQDAKLVLTFPVGEIGVRVYGRFIIPDALLSKIKNYGKKMRDLYLQADYARRMELSGRCYSTDAGGTVTESDDEDEEQATSENSSDADFSGFYAEPAAGDGDNE